MRLCSLGKQPQALSSTGVSKLFLSAAYERGGWKLHVRLPAFIQTKIFSVEINDISQVVFFFS